MSHRTQINSKKIDFWILFLWNFVAFYLSYSFSSNYLISALFFFVLPMCYLLYKNTRLARNPLLFAFIFSVPALFITDYLSHIDGSFLNYSILGIRLFDLYPIEDFLWAIIYFLYIGTFYEYFFDDDRSRRKKLPRRFYLFAAVGITASALFVAAIFVFKVIHIPYFYISAVFVLFLLLPTLVLVQHREIFDGIMRAGLFFAVLSILYEYASLHNGEWAFPGDNFIGWVTLFDVAFPFEELLWLIFAAPAYLVYYEFFADNLR